MTENVAWVSYNLDYSRARAYCACRRCGWVLYGHFYSQLSFLSSFSLSLGDGHIIIIIIIIKSLFQEGNTISTKLISLAALRYLQFYKQIRAYYKSHIGTDVANTPTNQEASANKEKCNTRVVGAFTHLVSLTLTHSPHTHTHRQSQQYYVYINLTTTKN